uniref:RNA-directed DNA polymerase, eukaryota, reverse transcriptase zinc-binding domain protein n=1 Tax=Tanacetum cinerariifolium TaxID=118510 RepID=A0A6L2K8D9_TANCI|nr:RNA-directed DNA polymerase, eukaryota, reverse transcriptase zinc-binding domain protein [Tanacetum cinerariifolium]
MSNASLLERLSCNIFITNLPAYFSSKDLWNTCSKFGTVLDVYFPNKVSKQGKRYAFDRFIKVSNVDSLISSLRSVWLGSFHLYANVARFNRGTKTSDSQKSHSNVPRNTSKPSYAKVLGKKKSPQNYDKPVIVLEEGMLNFEGEPVLVVLGLHTLKFRIELFGLMWKRKQVYSAHLCVKTTFSHLIAESLKVIIKGKVYVVRAKEVTGWVPDFGEEKSDEFKDYSDNNSRLKEWSSIKRRNKDHDRKVIQDSLIEIDLHLDKRNSLLDDLTQRVNLFCNLKDIDHKDSIDLAQKAKIKWVVEGDENSKFFHDIVNKKIRHLSIKAWDRSLFDVNFPRRLNSDQVFDLEDMVSNEEIKRAVWDCGFDKSPGPDGFTFEFFKKFWTIDHLEDILHKYGFRIKWHGWIHGCLQSSKASVLVNDSPTDEFSFHRGLRKGDPISPFLFILVMQSLHVSFQRLIDRVKKVSNKLSNWKAKTHSVGGRLTLLKSVLGEIPTYYMSLFKAPKGIISLLEKMCNKFFLGADTDDCKITWVCWNKVLAHKNKGGLRVNSLYALNLASIFKWIWRFLASSSSLWIKVINSIHGNSSALDNPYSSQLKNLTWIGILKAMNKLKVTRVYLMGFGKIVIGNGSTTRYWHDIWYGDICFNEKFKRMFNLELQKDANVASKLQAYNVAFSFRRPPRSGLGDFSVKSAREEIDKHVFVVSPSQNRWFKVLPNKLNVFSWLMMLDRLPTRWWNIHIPIFDDPSSWDSKLNDSEDIQCAGSDHDHYQEAACAHHEEHVMHDFVHLNHVVDSHDDYTSDSNIILCDQYVTDNEVPVIHSDLSYVPDDAFMMIYDDLCEPHDQPAPYPSRNSVVKNSLTAELATYKEHVELYEQRAKFELTEREQKINEQLRIVISDRNFKEETIKREFHSIKLQLASTINHNKSMVEEVSFQKKDFKQKENKYIADFLDIKTLKEKVEDKVAIGYKNPLCLTHAKQVQPTLYNGHEIIKDNHTPAIVHNAEDTLEITEITRKKMNDKMNDPECVTRKVKIAPHDCSKENLLATFTPQKQLTPNKSFVFCVATNSELNVARFIGMHVANTTAETRCLALKAELANLRETNNHDNQKELINHFSKLETTDSQITKSTDHVTQLQAQNDLFRAENDKIKQYYKELYDSIKITHDKHIKQMTKLTTNNVNLKTYVCKATVNPEVSVRDKHAIDVEPVVPRLRNNRDAHLDYLGISRKVLKQFATSKKQVTISKPSDKSDSTTHQHVMTVKSQKTNVLVPPSTGVSSCPNAPGSQPKSHVKENRISPAKGDNKLPVDDQPRKISLTLECRIGSAFCVTAVCSITFGLNKTADVNTPSGQTLTMATPVCADDQILPHIRWIPIRKSNCYLDMEISQSNLIYKIAVDLLKNTNFLRAFTASSTIPSIYIQQFWDTILNDKKVGCYKCQLDEQWFNLTKETLREALQITPVNHNQAFAAPPSIDGLIDFVNQLGYPKLIMNLSNVVTNDLFQPWRALLTIINLCLMGKTSGFERPRAPRKHIFHPRPDSSLYLSNEEPILGYLKFSAKGTKSKVFRMPIPYSLIIVEIQQATYYQEYLAKATETTNKPAKAKRIKRSISRKTRQPRISPKSVGALEAEEVPTEEPQVADEDVDYQKAMKESMKDSYALPKGPLPPVVIREPESRKYQPLPEVPRKGKAKVAEEQSDNEDESKKVMLGAEKGGQDEDQAGPDPDAQAKDQTGSDAGAQADGQAGSNPDETFEGQAGSNPNETSKGQARPDSGGAEAKVQSISSPVVHAGSDREHMDLDIANVSPQPSTEQLDEGFTATVYLNVQENFNLAVEETMLLEEGAISSGTLSSLQHLSRDFSFGDQFFSDKLLDADKNAKTEVESMENQQLKATTTDTTTTTTTTLPPPQAPQQSTTKAIMVKRIGELEHILADLIQINKNMEERDLPKTDMKEILHQRMWESDSYKSHEDHMQLFEALKKSMNRDHSEELVQDLAEARKKRKKTQMPPSPPPPSSTNQESPSKGFATPSPSKSAALVEYQAWMTIDIRLRPSISLTLANLEMDEDMAPDEQAQSSNDEDIESAHFPTVNLRQGWWKPFEEERPTTLKPACVDDPILRHNISKPLPLGGPPGQVTIQSDFFFNKDLEYLRFGSKGRRRALSISKMKAAYYPDAGLEQMMPDQFWIEEECKYDIAAMYGISHWWFQRQRFYIDRHTSEGYHSATQVNLTKPQWTATAFEYKHDYTVIESPRAVIFRDKYEVQMMMRFNEIHKFSDGTLLQINEALDYKVKEYRINRLNLEAFENTEDLPQPGELCWRTRQRGRLHTSEAYRLIKLLRHSRPLSDNVLICKSLGKIKKEKSENNERVPTEMELELEYTQQGSSYEVSKHLLLSDIEDSVMDPVTHKSNPLTTQGLLTDSCFISHRVSRVSIDSLTSINELMNAFGKPFEVLNNVFEHRYVTDFQIDFSSISGFNSLIHSLRALSALRRSGLRTTSTAAKPCLGDSSEFYLITGRIHTDQQGTVVLATLFNESKQRHFRVKCGGDEKKELLVESRVLIPETTFVGVESRVLIPEMTFVDVESRVSIPEKTFVGVESRVVSPFPPSFKIGINSVQRAAEEIVDLKQMKMDWVPDIPYGKRGALIERLNSQICIRRNRICSKQPFTLEESPIDTMADQCTMVELLRTPTEGYVEAIIVPPILAEQFELKHSLINMMTSDQFFGLEKDNPHDHIRAACRWLEKELPRFIHTWEDLVQATPPPTFVKAVEEICVTYGGALPYYQCLATDGNTFPELWDNNQGYVSAAAANYNQVNSVYRPPGMANQIRPTGLGSLPSNTVSNRKGELKAITTRSGLVLDGPTVPTPPPFINLREDEHVEETLTDHDLSEYTIKVPPPPKLPEKLRDPRKFLILCGFNELKCKALADLGPFLRTARALIDVHGEEMILRNGDERLTLNMRHDTSSYSNQPQKEAINLINVFNNSSKYFLEDLFSTNQPSGNPTFSSHPELTSPKVKNDIFDPEGGNVLPEKLLNIDSTKNLHPPLHVNHLSGSITYFSSLNQLLEEFVDELTLVTFPSKYDDDLQFDIESDLKEIEYLFQHDPIKDIDSSLKDLIDQSNLANLDNNLFDSMAEMFLDEQALDYSYPLIFDIYNDDLFEVDSDTENVYDDPFDSKGEKIKEVDALPSTNNEDKKLAISNASLMLDDVDPPLYELPFFKEVPRTISLRL